MILSEQSKLRGLIGKSRDQGKGSLWRYDINVRCQQRRPDQKNLLKIA